ncbi:UNVERIFIED_CONTAM: hypothetical protein Sindi_1276000 [Sesamum indicum]
MYQKQMSPPPPPVAEEREKKHKTVVVVEHKVRGDEGWILGILETRVRINNVMHIQSFLLPRWKWFVDYATVGNRIWVAWDDNVVDVHILDLGNQFMHCCVTHRADSETLIITIVYGASEMIDRRSISSRALR